MAAQAAPLGVLVVDDSAVVRGIVQRGIGADAEISVLGVANDGAHAIELARKLSPDVVLLDVEMPVMDGLEALPKLLALKPGLSVIMASALTQRHADLSFKALRLGAADYVPKPEASAGNLGLTQFFDELRAKIKVHGRKARQGLRSPAASEPMAAPAAFPLLRPDIVAIGSSTGGPPALLKIFAAAKGAVRVPVFITQHMPPSFTAMLAQQLGQVSGARAFEGADNMRVEAGCIYVAPGGAHMLVERRAEGVVVKLSDGPPENFCKPAVDPMLRSLAKVYGRGVLASILTGMGRDGADGCVAVADAGGAFFAQDESTSVVWGMPGAAFRTGRAMGQLPLDATAAYLARAMRGQA